MINFIKKLVFGRRDRKITALEIELSAIRRIAERDSTTLQALRESIHPCEKHGWITIGSGLNGLEADPWPVLAWVLEECVECGGPSLSLLDTRKEVNHLIYF